MKRRTLGSMLIASLLVLSACSSTSSTSDASSAASGVGASDVEQSSVVTSSDTADTPTDTGDTSASTESTVATTTKPTFPFEADWQQCTAAEDAPEAVKYAANVYYADVKTQTVSKRIYFNNNDDVTVMHALPHSLSVCMYGAERDYVLDTDITRDFAVLTDVELFGNEDSLAYQRYTVPDGYNDLSNAYLSIVTLSADGAVVEAELVHSVLVDRTYVDGRYYTYDHNMVEFENLMSISAGNKILSYGYVTNESSDVDVNDEELIELRKSVATKAAAEGIACEPLTFFSVSDYADGGCVVVNTTDTVLKYVSAAKLEREEKLYDAQTMASSEGDDIYWTYTLYPGECELLGNVTSGYFVNKTLYGYTEVVQDDVELSGMKTKLFGAIAYKDNSLVATIEYKGKRTMTIPAGTTCYLKYPSFKDELPFAEPSGEAKLNGIVLDEKKKLTSDLTIKPGDTLTYTMQYTASDFVNASDKEKDLRDRLDMSVFLHMFVASGSDTYITYTK